jgi:hypothetical protein
MDIDPQKRRTLKTNEILAVIAGLTVLGLVAEGAMSVDTPDKEISVNCASPNINQRASVFRMTNESVAILDGVDMKARLDVAAGGIAVDTMTARYWAAGELMSSAQSSTVSGVPVEVFNGYQSGEPVGWHNTNPSDMITVRCGNAGDFTPVALGDGQ